MVFTPCRNAVAFFRRWQRAANPGSDYFFALSMWPQVLSARKFRRRAGEVAYYSFSVARMGQILQSA